MLVRVLLASQADFAAVAPVLAELDEARRALEPSDILIDAQLLGKLADLAATEQVASRLGLPLTVNSASPSGFAQSLMTGFQEALKDGVDVIVTLDADGQHDARQIPDLVRSHLARGSGLTIGSRWTRGGSAPGASVVRSAISRTGNAVVKAVTGARGVSDSTTSFRVYRPDVARLLLDERLPTETYGFFSAMVAVVQAHGFAVDEVPIVFRPRFMPITQLDQRDLPQFAGSLSEIRATVRRVRAEMRKNQAVWAQRNPRLRAQAVTGESVFGAMEEMTALAGADRFLTWIADELGPHLGGRVAEIGAGVGSVTLKLATADRRIVAVEPADNVFPQLASRLAGHPFAEARKMTSEELLEAEGPASFDSVVYVSVLEHIDDDVAELRTASQLVKPGGAIGLFVPAMAALYGSLDYKSGHYRRYDRELLATVIREAGLEVDRLHYLDVAGALPYFLMYRLLDVPTLDSGSSAVYDKLIVPVSRAAQRVVPRPPFGKNLVAIARRPGGSPAGEPDTAV